MRTNNSFILSLSFAFSLSLCKGDTFSVSHWISPSKTHFDQVETSNNGSSLDQIRQSRFPSNSPTNQRIFRQWEKEKRRKRGEKKNQEKNWKSNQGFTQTNLFIGSQDYYILWRTFIPLRPPSSFQLFLLLHLHREREKEFEREKEEKRFLSSVWEFHQEVVDPWEESSRSVHIHWSSIFHHHHNPHHEEHSNCGSFQVVQQPRVGRLRNHYRRK